MTSDLPQWEPVAGMCFSPNKDLVSFHLPSNVSPEQALQFFEIMSKLALIYREQNDPSSYSRRMALYR